MVDGWFLYFFDYVEVGVGLGFGERWGCRSIYRRFVCLFLCWLFICVTGFVDV